KVVERHAQLKKGAILKGGEQLLRIDPTDYELAKAQAEANLQSIQAQLNELKVKESNTEISLKIEQQVLNVARKELNRLRKLLRKRAVSQNSADQQERTMLTQNQQVQSLQNNLNLIPTQRQLLNAQRKSAQIQLESAKLNLKRTQISLPFDGRIAEVNVEKKQFAQQGQVLVIADSIDIAEVDAQIAIQRFRHLLQHSSEGNAKVDLNNLPKRFGLSSTVRLQAGDFKVEWPARFVRASDTVDPQTRTIGIVVAVDNPYRQAIPGIRPPLIKNMFVEVELRGKARQASLIIPRSALHQQQVYLVNQDNRLEKRPVETDFFQTDFVVIKNGLKKGEQLIVSDLIPAIEGMLLKPVNDSAMLETLLNAAQGKGNIK
ncbi:MAG TPA: efflux RND transporter periplasmic adaptor subunit, partial [Thiotrichaceae bacterium]|nr:efflux RND transporter periplasmic adaptor subunit [Thiotrichaceae bacterium]